jgi:protein-disulfide isomerase
VDRDRVVTDQESRGPRDSEQRWPPGDRRSPNRAKRGLRSSSASAAASFAFICGLVTAGCRPSPTPEDLRQAMVKNPDILYAVIEAHPKEFLDAVNKAARAVQSSQQASTIAGDQARIDAEFLTPKVPRIERRAVLGNPQAPVTIVEYSDFECPYCRQERDVLVELFKKYGDKLRLVVKQTPMDFHPHAMPAARMYEAIARQNPQGAYRYYDDLFAHQEQFIAGGDQFLRDAARRAGVDLARALQEAGSEAIAKVIEEDLEEGRRFGFTGTPGFLINGVSLQGAHPITDFEAIIDRHLAAASRR